VAEEGLKSGASKSASRLGMAGALLKLRARPAGMRSLALSSVAWAGVEADQTEGSNQSPEESAVFCAARDGERAAQPKAANARRGEKGARRALARWGDMGFLN
jgi:hypothetical protein